MQTLEELQFACRSSLHFLSTVILGYTDWDALHDDIEKFLIKPSAKKLLLVPRGHLKTSIVTKAFPIKCLLNDFNARILIANQVWDRARDMLQEIKGFLTNKSELPKIFGEFVSDRWREDGVVIRQRTKSLSAPSIGTTGVEAEQTSAHYDVILLDDIVGKENYKTPEQRAKTLEFYRSTLSLLEPAGMLIVVGTRWHMDDIYGHILDEEPESFDIMVRQVIEHGKIIFPKKFSLHMTPEKRWIPSTTQCMDYIRELKKSQGPMFYGQYMNNPVHEENQKFKRGYFQYWDKRPERLSVGMAVDFAIGQSKESDYTAIVVGAFNEYKDLFLLDYIRGHWHASQIIENIITMYQKWKPDYVGAEKDIVQRTLAQGLDVALIRAGAYISVQELAHGPDKKKEFRIEALEPFYRNKKVYHANWMKQGALEDELVAFPRAKHDDLIDAQASLLEILPAGDDLVFEKEVKPGTMAAVIQEIERSQPRDYFSDLMPRGL